MAQRHAGLEVLSEVVRPPMRLRVVHAPQQLSIRRARASGIDEETFRRVVAEADEGCPFSKLIKASAKVSIDAAMEVADG